MTVWIVVVWNEDKLVQIVPFHKKDKAEELKAVYEKMGFRVGWVESELYPIKIEVSY